MERIGSLATELVKSKKDGKVEEPRVVECSLSWMGYYSLLPPKAAQLAKKIRPIMESPQVYSRLIDYIEADEFPEDVFPPIRDLDITKYFYEGEFGDGSEEPTYWERVALTIEASRVDLSLATMMAVQCFLLGKTIEVCGSEEQKNYYLPRIKSFELIGGFGLTEADHGSDASNLSTTVQKMANGDYLLNGNKRWIGNANKDIIIVFAKDTSDGEVGCYIVHLTSPGITRTKIQRKLALRPVQNMVVLFKDVIVPEKNKLPGVQGFLSVASLLAESRIMVGFMGAGLAIGLYDFTIKQLVKREQFGRPLAAFQLTQEKIFKIMSRAQAALFMCHHVYSLHLEGKATFGMISMAKAFSSEMAREAAKYAREALGGNGIIIDNHAMKCLADAEALYTYEGTYDINLLVAGRELTGLPAFKTR